MGFADLMQGDDVGMMQSRNRLGLTSESLRSLPAADQFTSEALERYPSTQLRVFRQMDDAHATTADLREQAIWAQPLRDSEVRSESVRGGARISIEHLGDALKRAKVIRGHLTFGWVAGTPWLSAEQPIEGRVEGGGLVG